MRVQRSGVFRSHISRLFSFCALLSCANWLLVAAHIGSNLLLSCVFAMEQLQEHFMSSLADMNSRANFGTLTQLCFGLPSSHSAPVFQFTRKAAGALGISSEYPADHTPAMYKVAGAPAKAVPNGLPEILSIPAPPATPHPEAVQTLKAVPGAVPPALEVKAPPLRVRTLLGNLSPILRRRRVARNRGSLLLLATRGIRW